MGELKIISQQLLDNVSAAAHASPRQRKNFNFHQHDNDICHRLLNALEPDSYIPPHCHRDDSKGESIVILRGKVGVLIFADDGALNQRIVMQPESEILGVDIPPGMVHSLIALTTNSVFFESKAGPYVALTQNERANWAPPEGADAAREYLTWMKSLFLVD
jgi:cupin fold WbuC family metalloprotein